MKNSRLVYSTETGRVCSRCGQAAARCTCRKPSATKTNNSPFPADGTVRIRRETKGRKGKTVTAVYGILEGPADLGNDLTGIARNLKQRCGTGGSVKDGLVVIQGDHRQTLQAELRKIGYTVKII